MLHPELQKEFAMKESPSDGSYETELLYAHADIFRLNYG